MRNPTKENILKAHSEGCEDTKKAIEINNDWVIKVFDCKKDFFTWALKQLS